SVSRSREPLRAPSFVGLLGNGWPDDFDAHHVTHAPATPLIEWHNETEMVGIQRLAVHPLGHDHLFALKFRRDLAQRQYRAIAVPTENHDGLRYLVSVLLWVDHTCLFQHRPQ